MPRNLSPEDIAQFRERLIDAAERLFAEHGTEAVTIRQLAAELGVSPMTPYRYFKDKDAILAAVRTRGFDRFAEALEKAYAASAENPAGATEPVGRAYVRFALENREAYKLMFDISQPSGHDYPELVRAAERARATMTRHLKNGAGSMVKGDPELVGRVYWAALHGPIMLELSGGLRPPYGALAVIEALFTALDRR
ncbi:MAG: TetR/AcrR family transcriptional regulator [Caulobacteraceae bacterium]